MFVLKTVALLSTCIDHSKDVSPRSGREEEREKPSISLILCKGVTVQSSIPGLRFHRHRVQPVQNRVEQSGQTGEEKLKETKEAENLKRWMASHTRLRPHQPWDEFPQ